MTSKDHALGAEELYDWICVQIGFEEETKALRNAIKAFGRAREKEGSLSQWEFWEKRCPEKLPKKIPILGTVGSKDPNKKTVSEAQKNIKEFTNGGKE